MATVSGDSSRSLAVGDWGRAGEADSKSDRYLAKRLAAAGADYKGVALITFLLGAAVGALAWLAIGVALEHWVVPGGLPRWARWTWLAALLTALAAAALRWIVPLVRYRVNLVYAARAIEQEHPDLHNDIVNAVLVKAHPDGSAPMVVRSLERRAAKRLSGLPADGVIDRSLAVRLAYALAVLVGVACLYQVVAPKSLVMSMVRLVAPWAGVAVPSRVQISAPRLSWRMPGDDREAAAAGDLEGQRLELNGAVATLVRGRQLVVAVDVRGLRREERPTLTVTPMRDDGSFDAAAATWQVGMERRRASDTHVAVLPDAARGIDHSLEFVVAAGDARTEPVRVAVVDSPSLLVREIRYDYPAYTRLPPETMQWQGDVRAVEGTRVTVVAESNRPLAEAWIEFDGSGKHDRVMKVGASDLARATASFDLRMNADRSAPEHATYRLVFRPRGADGSKAEQVVGQMDHRIEVVADLAPEISIEHPRESPLRVPADAPVNVAVRAVDPDFGLARVGIEMRLQDGRPLPEIVILGKPTAGVFKGVAEFVPAKLGAAAGTAIEYRGVAADTRPQQPNVAHTQWQKLIIDPSAPPPAPPPKSDAPREQDPQADKQGGEEGGAGQQDGKQEKGSAQGGKEQDGTQEGGKQQDGKQEGGEQQDGKQPNGGGEAAGGQEGKPQDQSQSDGRQSEGKKEQSQKEPGKKEPGEDEPGKQNGANDGSQKGSQQSNDAGSTGAKQSGQPPQQPGGNQKNNGSDAAGGGEKSGAKAQDGGDAESKSGGRDGKGQQGDGRNQQPQQQQQSGAKQGGQQKPRDTVAADGTNDGKAMERILEHRRQQEGQQGQQDQQRQKQDQQRQSQEGGQKEQGQKQQGQQGQQEQKKEGCPDCAGPDGKPCGKPGCSSCKGGGSKPGGGGASPSSSGGAGQQSGQGEEQGQGQQQGQKEGQGQGQEGQGKEGQGQQGQGKEGQGDGGQGNQQGASDGKQPGTQPGKQSGKGAEGAGQPAASGGQPSEQSGEGEPGAGEGAGSKPSGGEQAGEGKGSRPSKDGEKGDARAGAGDGPGNETSERGEKQGPAPGDQPSDQTKPGQQGQPGQEGKPGEQSQPGQEGLQAGKPSDQVSPTGRGGWSNGERELRRGDGAAGDPPPARETEWGEQDLASARNAADLAIEHLRKSVEAGRTDVLEQLGWTPEQARAFLDRWQSLRRLAGSDDPRQRGEFDRAIRSLGLRPAGVRSSRDVPADVKGGQAEGRRTRPPSEYRDQVKAYLQGTGTE